MLLTQEMKRPSLSLQIPLILAGLILVTLAIYAQVFHHEFVELDVTGYITENPKVQAGLTLKGIHWAFTNLDAGLWQPITWISWMADYQFFGSHPGWHHLMNVFYHLAGVLLLFFWLRELTGSVTKSALAVLLFAVHPLRVESVAWIAERKDTLSLLFWLGALFTYTSYVKQNRKIFLGWTAILFILGAMTKPMVISLPIVLMLLDYWPLKRLSDKNSFLKCVFEKMPLWLIAIAIGFLEVAAVHSQKAVQNLGTISIGIRLENIVVSYARYISKTFFPIHLSVIYPYPTQGYPILLVLGASLFLGLITFFCLRFRKKAPYLIFGWSWFVITLLPVIGIVVAGHQAMADRFTYIPHIGLLIAIVWGVSDWVQKHPHFKFGAKILAGLTVGMFGFLSWHQAGYWKNSVVLNEHALAVTENNYLAHTCLGLYYEKKGDLGKASYHYARSLEIRPGDPDVLNNFGNTLLRMGRMEDAEEIYSLIEKNSKDHIQSLVNMGIVLAEKKEWDKAEDHFRRALQQDPNRIKAWLGLGEIETERKQYDAAKKDFEKALSLDPENEEANYLSGNLEVAQKNYPAARPFYEKTLRANPNHFKAAYNLGNILFLTGDYAKALDYYEKALKINPEFDLARQQVENARLRLRSSQ